MLFDLVNVVVLWLVDGEMCGKCGLLHVIFWRVENRHIFDIYFLEATAKERPGAKAPFCYWPNSWG